MRMEKCHAKEFEFNPKGKGEGVLSGKGHDRSYNLEKSL